MMNQKADGRDRSATMPATTARASPGRRRATGASMQRLAVTTLIGFFLVAHPLTHTAARQEAALTERAGAALRKSVEFYRTKVAAQGGYHFAYAEDLTYGRSEMSEGPTRVEVQREGTPIVGMAYLDAWHATGDRYYLDAARDVALALVKGQYCSGGWGYFIELDSQKRAPFPYRADGRCNAATRPASESPTTLDDNVTQAAARLLMRIDRELGFTDRGIHEASRFALDSLVRAQYPNGAWPQRYSRFPDAKAFPVRPASYPASWPRTW